MRNFGGSGVRGFLVYESGAVQFTAAYFPSAGRQQPSRTEGARGQVRAADPGAPGNPQVPQRPDHPPEKQPASRPRDQEALRHFLVEQCDQNCDIFSSDGCQSRGRTEGLGREVPEPGGPAQRDHPVLERRVHQTQKQVPDGHRKEKNLLHFLS